MTQRVASLATILVAVLVSPPLSRAADYRTETCKGTVEIDLGNRSPQPGGWLHFPPPGISPGRALELADHALRRSGLLGDWILAVEIGFVALRSPPATTGDLFYRIRYVGSRCARGEDNRAVVLVGLDGAVLLPATVGGGRDPAPPRPQVPRRGAPRRLAKAYDDVLAGYERLATGLEQTFKGVECSLFGCPYYDLILSSVSWKDGPPDVKIDAGSLPARVLWFPWRNEWPQLSPVAAVDLAASRGVIGGNCDPGGPGDRFVPSLFLARPGGWLYVIEFDGQRCRPSGDPLHDRLKGELIVLMTGDILLPTDGAFTWLPKDPEDHTTVDGMVFYNLLYQSPSRRRFIPPSWLPR